MFLMMQQTKRYIKRVRPTQREFSFNSGGAHHARPDATSVAATATAYGIQLAGLVYKALNMASFRGIWQSLPLRPAANDFDRPTSLRERFQEVLAQVWTIDHSPWLDQVSETTYLSVYVTLNLLTVSKFHRLLKTHLFYSRP